MKVIPHQHPGMNTPAVTFANPPHPLHEKQAILSRIENEFSAIAASHHVIDGPGVLKSKRPSHAKKVRRRAEISRKNVIMQGLTPGFWKADPTSQAIDPENSHRPNTIRAAGRPSLRATNHLPVPGLVSQEKLT
jgi:hypothetical protein